MRPRDTRPRVESQMKPNQFVNVPDDILLRDMASDAARERDNEATRLERYSEVDRRRLYAPRGYASMYAYCVRELRLSDDMAFKRIRVARAARRFPAILPAIQDGRLNLSTVTSLI